MQILQSVEIDGISIPADTEYFHFPLGRSFPNAESLALLAKLPKLKGVSFGQTNLTDRGLQFVCRAAQLENLDLQETKVSNSGLESLAALSQLKYLRLKDNPQLDNRCVMHLLKLTSLLELQIHETNIDDLGLVRLRPLQGLSEIILNRSGRFSLEGVAAASKAMPWCTFFVKGHGSFDAGHLSQ